MKYFTVEEIIKLINKLLEHGWGSLVIDVQDHKIPHCDYHESLKPGEKDDEAT